MNFPQSDSPQALEVSIHVGMRIASNSSFSRFSSQHSPGVAEESATSTLNSQETGALARELYSGGAYRSHQPLFAAVHDIQFVATLEPCTGSPSGLYEGWNRRLEEDVPA